MQSHAIDRDRLVGSLEEMARIGATAGGGVTRLALSDEDRQARDLLGRWFEEAGLQVMVDDFGNMTGLRAGRRNAAPVVMGSHLDTVVRGGQYDGALGVLGALEVVRTMNDLTIGTDYPVAVVNWTNEEGARFPPAMLGSGGATGVFSSDYVDDRTDIDGLRFGDELNRIGYRGRVEDRLNRATGYLELHVEQGPVLEDANVPVGVVGGIVGITWIEANIEGKSDHAGPTPMLLRHDPLVAAGRAISMVRQIAVEQDDIAVATVGRVVVEPNVPNTIPADVMFSVDMRHPDGDALDAMASRLTEVVEQVCDEQDVLASVDRYWTSGPTPFDERVVKEVVTVCEASGIEFRELWSGAGHDAKYMADICPAGMIFVRSQNGVSHAEGEYSSNQDCAQGVQVLFDTVRRLATS